MGLVSFPSTKDPTPTRISTTVPNSIVCIARRQEFLRKSIYCIVLRTVLASVQTQKTIKDGLGGPMVSRAEAVKQYKKSKIKLKKELKDIKKLKNVLFSIAKKSGSRRDIKKIKKIDAKSSRKRCNSSSDSSSDELDSNS